MSTIRYYSWAWTICFIMCESSAEHGSYRRKAGYISSTCQSKFGSSEGEPFPYPGASSHKREDISQFRNIFFFSWHPDSIYLYFRFPAPPTISDMRTSSFILVIRILLYPVIRLVGFPPSFLGRPATQHSALGITDHISRIPGPTLKQ
ncbi:uncharacterized protein RAG0_08806 [Rhynchosporium agropyri]|uniref:Uncharacterized protein n=1 Tax=Rhynchosporium agropyri TaxID=914238 RepID=A0A1E1KSE6_9HELO|nr:uncharacterized protein RAG0_08806 [Rhynchosporium agropyri]